ncbi:MAG: UDP-glucose 6-dehydrogenase, partial [Caulobacter sp.]|nr:UDP-glucose 6-dehydrogenase [Caulobacter sp.]
FKPNTDDMRDAPALDLIAGLQTMGARIQAYDPQGMREARHLVTDVAFHPGPYEAVKGADAVVIVTEWDQFRALDLERVKALLRRPVVIDLRNIYRPADMAEQGFIYVGVGRAGTRASLEAAAVAAPA